MWKKRERQAMQKNQVNSNLVLHSLQRRSYNNFEISP